MKYAVTCNTDNNYAQHCCAMLCSLFENNKEFDFTVYILTSDLSARNKKAITNLGLAYGSTIKFVSIDDNLLSGVKFRTNRPLTFAAYYRIILPQLLDDSIKQILYLDCDVIVISSIKDLLNIDLKNKALAACKDVSPYNDEHRRQLGFGLDDNAFCSGVMLINLDYWRRINATERLLNYSKTDRGHIYLHDQDALNYVFKDQWVKLPYKWNKTPLSIAVLDEEQKFFDLFEYFNEPKIIHYSSELKPWYNVWFPERKFYIKYLTLSNYDNITIVSTRFSKQIQAFSLCLRYYLNLYIHPLVPDIIELLLKDIFALIQLLLNIFRPQKLSLILFRRWLKKYHLRN